MAINDRSEIKPFKKGLLHRPGKELLNLTPDTLGRLLFDDIPFLKVAQQEHDAFAQILKDNGVEVDNIYLDNVASLRLYNHGTPVFAHDFRKQEFQSLIPKSFLSGSILRKMYFTHADAKALYYYVIIGIPDADTTYVIELRVTPDGRMSKKLK